MHRKRRYQEIKEVDISGQDMNASIDKKRWVSTLLAFRFKQANG